MCGISPNGPSDPAKPREHPSGTAQDLKLPCVVSGQLDKKAHARCVTFTAAKGHQYVGRRAQTIRSGLRSCRPSLGGRESKPAVRDAFCPAGPDTTHGSFKSWAVSRLVFAGVPGSLGPRRNSHEGIGCNRLHAHPVIETIHAAAGRRDVAGIGQPFVGLSDHWARLP